MNSNYGLMAVHLNLILLESVFGANILGLMGCASPSHHLWNSVIFDELASRGHNLTILAVDVSERHPENIHYIHLEETYSTLFNGSDKYDLYPSILGGRLTKVKMIYDYYLQACRGILKSKGLQRLLDYPDEYKFDLVLYDIAFEPCLIGFIHKFNYPPVIGLNAFKLYPVVVDHIGGHIYPGYIPFFTNSFDVNMTFWQRLDNTWIYVFDHLLKHFYSLPQMDKMVRSRFPMDLPKLTDLQKRLSLILANTHPSIDYPEPLPPNVIEVGGLQIKDPKAVPKDIDTFFNNSKSGVVYISMGTNVRSELLRLERQRAVIRAVNRMPEYNFLWKFDPKAVEGEIPSNLLIKDWFPQNDILAHPKVKVFVTHAGSLSIQEATWHGKPMVAIPIYADQPRNAHRAVSHGMAERIEFITMNEEIFYSAIKKVVSDPSYMRNAKFRSKLFKDRPQKPLYTAIWWIEYILRNPNPEHLKSPVTKLGYLRANSIDVLILIGIVFSFLIVSFFKLLSKFVVYIISVENNTKVKEKTTYWAWFLLKNPGRFA